VGNLDLVTPYGGSLILTYNLLGNLPTGGAGDDDDDAVEDYANRTLTLLPVDLSLDEGTSLFR